MAHYAAQEQKAKKERKIILRRIRFKIKPGRGDEDCEDMQRVGMARQQEHALPLQAEMDTGKGDAHEMT